MCKLISHVHTLAFSFVNIICVNCIKHIFLFIFHCIMHYICSFVLCTLLIGGNKELLLLLLLLLVIELLHLLIGYWTIIIDFRIRSIICCPKVIKLEFILRLKIKRNDWLFADTCPRAATRWALF